MNAEIVAPMVVDAHQHVWDLAAADYSWLDSGLAPINRTMDFSEALPSMRSAGVAATVLVQAADTGQDTQAMLRVADANPEVVGIVAWLPLDDVERAASILEPLRADRRVVGVRSLVHTRPDPAWLLRDDVADGLDLLDDAGLTFDYVTNGPEALSILPALSTRHPRLAIVIDHLGKPPIGGTAMQYAEWRRLITIAAENPNISAKVSGLYSSVGSLNDWTTEQVRPFFDDAMQLFGPDRLMFGSDWPISLLAGGYDRTWRSITELTKDLQAHERDSLLGGTATSFYRIDPALLARAASEREKSQ